jgi:hypothetical protein
MASGSDGGRCTDRLISGNFTLADSAAAELANLQICNTYNTRYKCIAQKQCMWKEAGDSCACTFDGCSCADPVGVWNQSAPWPRESMLFVVTPLCTFSLCACMSMIGLIYRHKLSKIIVSICPVYITSKLSFKDNLDVEKEIPEVKTERPSDSDEEANPSERKKKKKIDKRQEKRDYRGNWMLTVTVERAQHLPRLDSSLRDPSLIGFSGASAPLSTAPPFLRARRTSSPRTSHPDPYVKVMIVGGKHQQEQQTRVRAPAARHPQTSQ